MKKLAIVIVGLALFISPRLFAQMPTWDLSRALQNSFTQGADKVWYFMEGESPAHDPASYRLLPEYRFPCWQGGFGVGCWLGSRDSSLGIRTAVSFNFTNQLIGKSDFDAGYLPHTARLTPTLERLAIVAWQSPVTGTVNVSAKFRERRFEVMPVISIGWSVEKGAQTVTSGRIGPAGYDDGALATISRLPVAKNDVLYFVVDDFLHASDFITDSIDLRVTIAQVQ